MKRYKDWQPTGFDTRGLNADKYGIGGYLVLPCARNRDSGCLAESNFATALGLLGGVSDDIQVHRFGHWANGWFELILVNPAHAEKLEIAKGIEARLENYPVLDESDLSERELNQAAEYWHHMSVSSRVEYLQRAKQNVFAARRDELPEDSNGHLLELLTRD